MNKQTILLIASSLLLLISCGGAERTNDPIEASAENLSSALKQTVNNSILPTVDGFSVQANQFTTDVNSFCNVPNSSKLTTLQQRWKSLSQQWYKLALYNFGPLHDDIVFPKINFIDSLRQRGIDYTGTVRAEINTDLASTTALNEAFFSNKDFNRVGLLALELLVFETTSNAHSTLSQDIVAEYTSLSRKCDYLKGMSTFNVKMADYIRTGWHSNYLSTGTAYESLFLNEQLSNDDKSLPTLLTAVQTHLDYLAKRNVATVSAQVADYSFENIKSSINEINNLLNGTTDTIVSLFDIMSSAGAQSSVDLVKTNIANLFEAIQNEDAVQLIADLGKLDGNFKREIPEGLNVDLGINFTDGD